MKLSPCAATIVWMSANSSLKNTRRPLILSKIGCGCLKYDMFRNGHPQLNTQSGRVSDTTTTTTSSSNDVHIHNHDANICNLSSNNNIIIIINTTNHNTNTNQQTLLMQLPGDRLPDRRHQGHGDKVEGLAYVSLYTYVCINISLFICIYIYIYVCLSIYLSLSLSLYIYIYMYIYI